MHREERKGKEGYLKGFATAGREQSVQGKVAMCHRLASEPPAFGTTGPPSVAGFRVQRACVKFDSGFGRNRDSVVGE